MRRKKDHAMRTDGMGVTAPIEAGNAANTQGVTRIVEAERLVWDNVVSSAQRS